MDLMIDSLPGKRSFSCVGTFGKNKSQKQTILAQSNVCYIP
jgi:hypothetical protein